MQLILILILFLLSIVISSQILLENSLLITTQDLILF